jgi:anti-sigma-K factor RskA
MTISKLPFTLSGKANREWRQRFRSSRAGWRVVAVALYAVAGLSQIGADGLKFESF